MDEPKPHLPEKLAKWLSEHGYPFELRVGHAFRAAGWAIEHAKWFTDAETAKARELDIQASRYFDSASADGGAAVSLAVECKHSSDKPWVGFTAPRTQMPPMLQPLALHDAFSRDIIFVADTRKIAVPEILRPRRSFAHGLIKGFVENKQGDPTAPYAAIQSVLASAKAIGKANADLAVMLKEFFIPHPVLPVIVTDAPLYEYRLDSTGSATLTETITLPVLAPSSNEATPTVVWVVNAEHMSTWASEALGQLEMFMGALHPFRKDLYSVVRSRYLRENHYDPDPAP